MKNSRIKKLILFSPLLIAGAGVLTLGALNPGSVAETRPDHPDVRLRTRHYRGSLDETQKSVLARISTLKTYGSSWRVIATENNIVHVEVPVLVFTDDLTVTITPQGDGVVLDVRSASRVGKGDFGENRRHILQLLAALDAQLSA